MDGAGSFITQPGEAKSLYRGMTYLSPFCRLIWISVAPDGFFLFIYIFLNKIKEAAYVNSLRKYFLLHKIPDFAIKRNGGSRYE
jgi:hypothetical protein